MRIGIIGTGKIGTAIARQLTRVGHEVVLANSRGPETLRDLAAELGANAEAGTVAQAAEGELVVLAVPYAAVDETLRAAGPLDGRILIDVTNYYERRDGAELDPGSQASSAVVASKLPGVDVVKAFNTVHFERLAAGDRAEEAERLALPVAGDDPAAKARVMALIRELGFAPVDGGTLAESARQEPGSEVYGAILTADQAEAALR